MILILISFPSLKKKKKRNYKEKIFVPWASRRKSSSAGRRPVADRPGKHCGAPWTPLEHGSISRELERPPIPIHGTWDPLSAATSRSTTRRSERKIFLPLGIFGRAAPPVCPVEITRKRTDWIFQLSLPAEKTAGNKMLKRSLSVLSSLPAPSLRMEFETTYARFLSPVRRYAFSHEESKNRNRVLSTSSIARLDYASSKNEKRRIETSLDEVFRKEGRIPLNVSFLYSPNIFIPEFYSLHICSIYRPTFAST